MRDSTKLYIEKELPNHVKVDMEANIKNGYDWKEYFINNDEDEITKIQLKVEHILFRKGIRDLSNILNVQLYLDPDVVSDFEDSWGDDPGYDESYCLMDDCYLIVETANEDFLLRVNSDPYDPEDGTVESARFIAKFN